MALLWCSESYETWMHIPLCYWIAVVMFAFKTKPKKVQVDNHASCMITGLVSTGSKGDNWCRDLAFLFVSDKCLKSFNFGILNCCSVTEISCREECLLARNVVNIKNDFEVIL